MKKPQLDSLTNGYYHNIQERRAPTINAICKRVIVVFYVHFLWDSTTQWCINNLANHNSKPSMFKAMLYFIKLRVHSMNYMIKCFIVNILAKNFGELVAICRTFLPLNIWYHSYIITMEPVTDAYASFSIRIQKVINC